MLQGVAEVKEGLTFCLSLPLDQPGGNVLNPRRHPPRRAATIRDGEAAFNFPLAPRQSAPRPTSSATTRCCCICNIRRSGTRSPMSASMFDADGDGKPEPVYLQRLARRRGDPRPAERGKAGRAAEPWARFEGTEAKALGIENLAVPCVQGRGVMIDLHAHYGRARQLVGYDDLMRVCEADSVEVETRRHGLPPYRLRRDAAGDEQAGPTRELLAQ